MDFKAQYKHPMWQKRRLEMLESADFACGMCGDADSQLHVHHRQYFKGRMIWEYADNELEVLCDVCHHEAHELIDAFKSLIATLPVDGLDDVAALVAGYRSRVSGPAQDDGYEVVYTKLFQRSPLAFKAGEVAASASNLSIHVLDDLAFEIDRSSRGGRIDILIPYRKPFSCQKTESNEMKTSCPTE